MALSSPDQVMWLSHQEPALLHAVASSVSSSQWQLPVSNAVSGAEINVGVGYILPRGCEPCVKMARPQQSSCKLHSIAMFILNILHNCTMYEASRSCPVVTVAFGQSDHWQTSRCLNASPGGVTSLRHSCNFSLLVSTLEQLTFVTHWCTSYLQSVSEYRPVSFGLVVIGLARFGSPRFGFVTFGWLGLFWFGSV
jgi:hypothetical protein